MAPLFINREVLEIAVPQEMLDYLQRTVRTRVRGQRKLLGALSAKKILLYTSVLHWYVDHGLVIKRVHRSIDYEAKNIFEWFVE